APAGVTPSVPRAAGSTQRAGATASGTGRACETMNARLDATARQVVRRDIPKVERPSIPMPHPAHRLEVAVEDLAAPSHTQGGAAHETVDGRGIEASDKEFEIGIPLP